MKLYFYTAILGLGSLSLVVSAQAPTPTTAAPIWTVSPFDRSKIDYSKEPFWAWGVEHAPDPNEKQAVQGAPGAVAAAPPSAEELARQRRVEGSTRVFTLQDIRGKVVDWFPGDHPNPIPDVVRIGPAALGKDGRACGQCHLADGSGRPENASPAGLPAAYITRQLMDFRAGRRHSSDPRKANTNTMVNLAKAMSDAELQQAADYFSAVKWRPHVTVVETALVPATRIQGELFIPTARKLTEPIGNRIIEVPTDTEVNQLLRSARGTWIAYVPIGSIKKGEALVTTGDGSIVNNQIILGTRAACTTCHGPDLMGVAPDIPPLAGRSPSYLAREIFDIQQGARAGSHPMLSLMKRTVEKLTPDDIINITAYLASRPVPVQPAAAPKDLTLTRR
jgi:cytochrome c553